MTQRARTWVAVGTTMALIGIGAAIAPPASARASAADGDPAGVCAGMSSEQTDTPGNRAPVPAADAVGALAGGTRTIDVLANDSDPDGDRLAVVSVTTPRLGDVCIDSDGRIEYFAVSSERGYTDRFNYGITDGDLFRTATVTVTVKGMRSMRAQLLHRKTKRHKAQIRFTNPNDRTMVLLAGTPKRKKALLTRTISPGRSVGLRTKYTKVTFFALINDLDGYPVLVNVGTLNTRTGRQLIEPGTSAYFRQHPGMRERQRSWQRQLR